MMKQFPDEIDPKELQPEKADHASPHVPRSDRSGDVVFWLLVALAAIVCSVGVVAVVWGILR